MKPDNWGFMTPYDGEITKQMLLEVITAYKRNIRKQDHWMYCFDEDEWSDGQLWMCFDELEKLVNG